MAIAPIRAASGQFSRTSGRDPVELCEMAKLIALAAATASGDAAADPAEVSTRSWNQARTLVDGGDSMPLAWETLRQISGPERSLTWRDLLATLFSTSTAEQALRVIRREDPWPDLSEGEIAYALLFASRRLDNGGYLSPAVYLAKREELLRRDRRRKDGGRLRLPTENQITNAAGSWERACELAGIEGPPKAPPRERRARKRDHWNSDEALITEIIKYVEWLNGGRSSQRRYLAFRRDHPDAPALEAVQARGGLDSLVRRAKESDALAKARERDLAAASPEAQERRRQDRLARDTAKPQAQKIVNLLRERGQLSGREIEAEFGWAVGSSSTWLAALLETGAVIRTHKVATAKNARYRLPGELTDEQARDAKARRTDELLSSKKAMRVRAYFDAGAESTTAEVASDLGLSESAARAWINKLLDAGLIIRRVVGLPNGGRSYRYHVPENPQ